MPHIDLNNYFPSHTHRNLPSIRLSSPVKEGGPILFQLAPHKKRPTNLNRNDEVKNEGEPLRIHITLHKNISWGSSTTNSSSSRKRRRNNNNKREKGKDGITQHASFTLNRRRRKGEPTTPTKSSSDDEDMVMTWFNKSAPPQREQTKSKGIGWKGMGTGSSREQNYSHYQPHPHPHPLEPKGRSQSSSALFYPQQTHNPTPNSNNMMMMASSNAFSSIPQEMWASTTPTKHPKDNQRRMFKKHHHHQKQNTSIPNHGEGKLYAISCPDVQEALILQEQPQLILPPPPAYRTTHQAHCPLHHASQPTLIPNNNNHPHQQYQQHHHHYQNLPLHNRHHPPGHRMGEEGRSYSMGANIDSVFPAFVLPENIFEVHLTRDHRGLGLSVCGGRDSQEKYPGLIRIKKVFPMSPASECGRIIAWDVILQANGKPLTGLSNQEALSLLRTTPTLTILTLCRPPPDTLGFCDPVAPTATQIIPKTNNLTQKSKSLSSLKVPPPAEEGEFEIRLEKVAGSLGFTLGQGEGNWHYVRALVKEPALTDGRIQQGDKILAVNGQALHTLSHAEAISFLRQCGNVVVLQLWRDPSNPSPSTDTEDNPLKPKPLRVEALEMLKELRKEGKHSLPGSRLRPHPHSQHPNGPATLPRRTRHQNHPAPSPQALSAALSRFASQPNTQANNKASSSNAITTNSEEDVLREDAERSSGSGESTPLHNSTNLNDKDPYRAYHDLRSDSIVSTTSTAHEEETQGARRSASFSRGPQEEQFKHGQPKYMSAIIHTNKKSASQVVPPLLMDQQPHPLSSRDTNEAGGRSSSSGSGSTKSSTSKGLLKWKGVVLCPNEGDEDEDDEERWSPDGRECCEGEEPNQTQSHSSPEQGLFTVELSRRWCSRLGFSIEGRDGKTYIKAIYPDSVAAKDGRLRVGDELVMVNGDEICDIDVSEVIDRMRKTRGTISITLLRPPNSSVLYEDEEFGLR